MESWFRAKGYAITSTQLFESAEFPSMGDIDFLVVMGGPMSVNDEDEFPWLAQEKAFVRAAVESGTPVLGVCLGAQLIASALGAKVYRNPIKEIGFYPVCAVADAPSGCFRFPESVLVFHWPAETFDLPQGAVHLARSTGCENQAFQIGSSVIGLQFHLETTSTSAAALVANCRHELVESPSIQSEAEILSVGAAQYESINQLMGEVLTFLTQA